MEEETDASLNAEEVKSKLESKLKRKRRRRCKAEKKRVRKQIVIDPNTIIPRETIRAKVQPTYSIRDKERPEESIELFEEFILSDEKISKKVKISTLEKSEPRQHIPYERESHLTNKFIGPKQLDEIERKAFTSSIQGYFDEQHPSTHVISQISIIEPELKDLIDNKEFLQSTSDPSARKSQSDKIKQTAYLSALEATAVVAVIDKVLDQLSILKYLLPDNSEEVNQKYQQLKERFGKKISRSEMKEFQLPEELPHQAEQNLKKIQTDRAFFQTTLYRTACSLMQTNSFWPITTVVDDQRIMAEEELLMAWKWPVTCLRMQQARDVLEEASKALGVMPIKHSVYMQEMQEGMSHALLTLHARHRYIDRWESARRSQHHIMLSREEESLRKRIMDLGARTVDEIRVGEEVTRFIEMEERRLRALLVAWEQRHEKEIEHVNMAIVTGKLTLDVAQYHTETTLQELLNREAELKEWQARRDGLTRRVQAVLVLQTWWRSYMYRRRVASAVTVIKKSRLEFANFAQKIMKQAEDLAILTPPTEEEKRMEEKERAKEKKNKKEDDLTPEEKLKLIMDRLSAHDRLVLSRKFDEKKRLMLTMVLAALQSLLGSAEARKVLEAEEAKRLEMEERRRRRRMFIAQGTYVQPKGQKQEDVFSGGTDDIVNERTGSMKRASWKKKSRPHIPGIRPRFTTALTDRLARASYAAKIVKKMRAARSISTVSQKTKKRRGRQPQVGSKSSLRTTEKKAVTFDEVMEMEDKVDT